MHHPFINLSIYTSMGNATSTTTTTTTGMDHDLWRSSSATPTPRSQSTMQEVDVIDLARARSASPNLFMMNSNDNNRQQQSSSTTQTISNLGNALGKRGSLRKSTSMVIDQVKLQRPSFASRESSLVRLSKTLKGLSRSSSSSEGFSPLENGTPVKVTKNVYLGNMDLALIPEQLHKKYGITHILNLCSNFKEPSASSGIVSYSHNEMSDDGDTDLTEFMKVADDYINDGSKKGKVFVHCRLGQNRSSTVIVAWLIKTKRMTLENALEYMKDKNPIMHIHPKYLKQLGDFEEKELGVRSQISDIFSTNTGVAEIVNQQHFVNIENLQSSSNQSPRSMFDFINVEDQRSGVDTTAM